LATLWSPVGLEIPYLTLEDMLLDYIGPNGEMPLSNLVSDALKDLVDFGEGTPWYGYIYNYLMDQVANIVQNIVTDRGNLISLLSNYVTDDPANITNSTPISIDGNYKDQPGIYPPRPYLLPSYIDGSEPTAVGPWTWNITNLSALPQRPNFLGYPMTPNFDSEVSGDMNLKIALTLYLLQFKDGMGGSFGLLQSKDDVDNFVQALTTGSILDKLQNVVSALNIDDILDYGVFDNPQLEAYLKLVKNISMAGTSDIMALIDELYEFIIKPFNISLDFDVLLNAWIDMPDWTPIDGVRVGQIANHSLLGGLYNSLDNFVNDQSGLIGSLSHWVSSKIPRVNSANGWDYRGPGNPTGVAFGHDGLIGDCFGGVVEGG